MTRYLLYFVLLSTIVSCSSRARLEMKKRDLPKEQISQNYTNISKDQFCKDGPVVRFVNFTFDKKDSLRLVVDITTSLGEERLNGDLTILLDEYEMDYSGQLEAKQYLETLEIESQSRYPNHFIGRQSLVNILIRSAAPKSVRKRSQKQYWNTLSLTIEPEDEMMMFASSDIIFSVKTERCELMIYPSQDQVSELKKFLN